MPIEMDEEALMGLRGTLRRAPNRLSPLGKWTNQAASVRMIGLAAALLLASALLTAGSAALAATLSFKAQLTGGGEAPRNDSGGSGELRATLDTDTNMLTWTVTYSGLTGAPIAAHFHGPVSWSGLTSEDNAPIQVGHPGSLATPFKGSTSINEIQAKDLKDGRWYFNIHTAKYPAGEIRGPVYRQ
jgi:hypothetical protein